MVGQGIHGSEHVFPLPGKTKRNFPDIFPWRPDNNRLSPNVIKSGIPPVPIKNEQALSVGPNMMVPLLKHWTALPALSYFLTHSMHVRETSRRINSPSTFKPPPRVTLTEQKREAWLRDLANVTVPLRKLGRTIPHGLANASLLDQILTKRVPIERAVWLIRCVGANELRSLRRKVAQTAQSTSTPQLRLSSSPLEGSEYSKVGRRSAFGASNHLASVDSAEQLWLFEWSEHLVTYLGTTINEFDTSNGEDWQANISYMIRLSCHLFYESLLDKNVFLEWILRSLKCSKNEHVPAVLFLANIFWGPLTQPPTIADFVGSLCARNRTLRECQLKTSTEQLDNMILRLVTEHADVMVFPKLWPEIEVCLRHVAKRNSDNNAAHLNSVITTLATRNSHFTVSQETREPDEWKAVIDIGGILGNFSDPWDYSILYNELLAAGGSKEVVLEHLFRWTLERGTDATCRVCVSLCVHMRDLGVRVENSFISFLLHYNPAKDNGPTVYDLVTELYKHGIFNMETYFRRLIASGTLYLNGTSRERQRAILKNLPFCLIPRHARSQAKMLLKEPLPLPQNAVLPAFEAFKISMQELTQDMLKLLPKLLKSEELLLANAICKYYFEFLSNSKAKVTVDHLSIVVAYMEALRNKTALYHIILRTVSTTDEKSLFFAAVRHFATRVFFFSSMGLVDELLSTVYRRYKELNVSFPSSTESQNAMLVLRSAVKSPKLKLEIEQRMQEAATYQLTSMSPDSGEDDTVFSETYTARLQRALDDRDWVKLAALRHHHVDKVAVFRRAILEFIRDNATDLRLIIKVISNNCIGISSVDDSLKDDLLLVDMLFSPAETWDLNVSEVEYLRLTRQFYLLSSNIERALKALVAVEDATKMQAIVDSICQATCLHPSTYAEKLLMPLTKCDDSCYLAPLKKLYSIALNIDLDTDRAAQQLAEVVAACTVFNLKVCQSFVLFSVGSSNPEEYATTVLTCVLEYSPSESPAWQSIFFYLHDSFKAEIALRIRELIFNSSPAHPKIKLLCKIYYSLARYTVDGAEGTSASLDPEQLLSFAGRICTASEEQVHVEPLYWTISFLAKAATRFLTGRVNELSVATAVRDGVLACLRRLQNLPLVLEDPQLRVLVSDALLVLNSFESATSFDKSGESNVLQGLMMYSRSRDQYSKLEVSPFDLIEDASNVNSINDLPIDLARFETYVEIKDPS